MKAGTVIIAASSFTSSNVLGGHYRSAAAIAELLREDYEVILLNFGERPSPVMQAEGIETIFYYGRPEWPATLRQRIAALMGKRCAKAVLAFDQKAGELLRPLARRQGVGFVLVKPGGGQPRLYYPKVDHNIVFMSTDDKWLTKRNPPNSRIAQAVGRIYEPTQDMAAQEALREKISLTSKDMAIVRIGRLHEHYAAVNRAALALAQRLRTKGFPARLIMIGAPQSPHERASLMSLKGPEDAIICEDYFTNQASRMLGMFRYNVGTGRGFMEGAAMGQVMFCACQSENHELPLLVTEGNLRGFLDDNFSPRITPDVEPETNLQRIYEMAQHPGRQAALSEMSRDWFLRFFSAETSRLVYLSMIQQAVKAPECFGADHLKSELHLRFSVILDLIRQRIAK